jgi:glucose-6-phosphate 1-epimerase
MIPPVDPDTPCVPVRVRAADGALLVVCSHGGHVVGWTPAGEDRDRLWLSPLARCGPGEAIRGGVPVIFPQFADRGPLPKHGIARDRTWELDTGSDGAPVARVACRLRDDEATRRIWPHRFTLTLVAEASGPELTITLQVRNEAPADGDPFGITAALHSYLAVDAGAAQVLGLSGRTAQDNAAGGAPIRLPDTPLLALGPRDVAVVGASGPVRVVDGLGGLLELAWHDDTPDDTPDDVPAGGQGFDSVVVWNPGDRHGLADVPPDGARQFVCAEPALLLPTTVAPQGLWRGGARLTALVPDS